MNDKKKIDALVGSNIKLQRMKAGYTQEKFSELIGIGTKSLSAIFLIHDHNLKKWLPVTGAISTQYV